MLREWNAHFLVHLVDISHLQGMYQEFSLPPSVRKRTGAEQRWRDLLVKRHPPLWHALCAPSPGESQLDFVTLETEVD